MPDDPRPQERPHETPQEQPKPVEPLPPNVPLPPDIELGGRGGLDPTRYGDWEKGGIAVDF